MGWAIFTFLVNYVSFVLPEINPRRERCGIVLGGTKSVETLRVTVG